MLKSREHVAVDVRESLWLRRLRPDPPGWVAALRRAEPERWLHVVEAITDAEALSAPALEAAVSAAYGRIARTIRDRRRHAVRFWNFIPRIHAELDDRLDRYMAFNAGRFAAFREWFGPDATFTRDVPTASAVGVSHGPLVIHALACAEPGVPVENPRQIPAYSYSRRYGPRPPCFARATRLASPLDAASGSRGGRLLVGGTASIVGEDSQHERDARQQAIETFDNLTRLLVRAADDVPADGGRSDDPLRAFTELRVYIVREEDAGIVRELVDRRFAHLAAIEYAQADLCRRELLVEIEGAATI